jgi:hypothetical protein
MANRERTQRHLAVMMVGASALLVTGGGAIAAASANMPGGPTRLLSPQSAPQSAPQSPPQSGPQAPPGTGSQSSTKVTTAGDALQGALPQGMTADFSASTGQDVGKMTCASSSFTSNVPQAPSNAAAGPVSLEMSAPSFSDCDAGTSLVKASLTTNSDNGTWSLALQHDPAGTKGTLTVPQAGLVVTISGLANCTGTIAPDGPVTIPATWTPGTATSDPQLSVSSDAVPMKLTGDAICPASVNTGAFSATYNITDTTTPGSQIAVTG